MGLVIPPILLERAIPKIKDFGNFEAEGIVLKIGYVLPICSSTLLRSSRKRFSPELKRSTRQVQRRWISTSKQSKQKTYTPTTPRWVSSLQETAIS
jgi:hypothetical protein